MKHIVKHIPRRKYNGTLENYITYYRKYDERLNTVC